jgi:hypothetical protein
MKCNYKCKYYHISGSNGVYKTVLKAMEIKDVRDKMIEVYEDCEEYKHK